MTHKIPFEAIRSRSISVERYRGPVAPPKVRGPTIPMMQAVDLWDGYDFALRRRFHFSRDWGVSLQGLMWPRVVIQPRDTKPIVPNWRSITLGILGSA